MRSRSPSRTRSSQRRRPAGRRLLGLGASAALLETAALWLRSGRIGGNVIVRCRQGHLFTTLWIPAASVKSLRLGWWRVQYCPTGRHWTVVTPVRSSELSEEERRFAAQHHDLPIP